MSGLIEWRVKGKIYVHTHIRIFTGSPALSNDVSSLPMSPFSPSKKKKKIKTKIFIHFNKKWVNLLKINSKKKFIKKKNFFNKSIKNKVDPESL